VVGIRGGPAIIVAPWLLIFAAGCGARSGMEERGRLRAILVFTSSPCPRRCRCRAARCWEYLGRSSLRRCCSWRASSRGCFGGGAARWERLAWARTWRGVGGGRRAPFAAAVAAGRQALLLWALVVAAALWAGRRLTWRPNFALLCAALAFIMAAMIAAVAASCPMRTRKREPFLLRRHPGRIGAARSLHHLPRRSPPAVDRYYLNGSRRCCATGSRLALLRGGQPAGVIVTSGYYARIRPHSRPCLISASNRLRAGRVFVYLMNGGMTNSAARPQPKESNR